MTDAENVRDVLGALIPMRQRDMRVVAEACVYVDDGISGAEFAHRLGFPRLMNA